MGAQNGQFADIVKGTISLDIMILCRRTYRVNIYIIYGFDKYNWGKP